jgi:hypothetical protein
MCDDRGKASVVVAHAIAFTRHLPERWPGFDGDRLQREALKKVDRLAHFRIGFGPRVRAFPDQECGERVPMSSHCPAARTQAAARSAAVAAPQ